ncbi:MAG: restriction endonuclease [Minisyncoccia bacterium]|jgi:restriction system protein
MRRYTYQDDGYSKARIITIIVIIWLFIFVADAFSGNQNQVGVLVEYTILVLLVYLGLKWLLKVIERKRVSQLFQSLTNLGLEDYIENFINRFSFEGKNINGWEFRNRKIDWNRINDLERYLIEKGVHLKTKKRDRDIFLILRSYIQQKEERLTRESIRTEPQKYALLSGSDFEKLLYRLYDAMGYKVEPIGQSGDQGGDLIANKNGERILIQAKCYRDWSVGNDAVQQVVGAMRYYNCNKTMVITTSTIFTPEAYALARANNTELISKNRLSELLMEFLHENWG